MAILDKLMNEAAFVAITLQELRSIIARDGAVESYKNSATQYGTKKSSAVEVYDKMLNTYAKVIAQLREKLPDSKKQETAGEGLMNFALGDGV